MANTGFDNNNAGNTLVQNALSNITGILTTRPNAKYMSGARCTLKINGKLVGFAFAITWNINTAVTEVNTIDDYLPYELAPQRVTIDGTISALHIPGTNPSTLGWQQDVLSFLFAPYVSIEARDSATNQIIFACDKVMITSRSEELKVDSLANVMLKWRGIGWVDEKDLSTTSPPNDYNTTSSTATPTTQGNPVTNAVSSAANAVANAVKSII